jgi:arginine utilization protein RocB
LRELYFEIIAALQQPYSEKRTQAIIFLTPPLSPYNYLKQTNEENSLFQ